VVIEIATPTRRDNVEPAVAVDIARGEAVPAAVHVGQTGKLRGAESAVIVQKDVNRTPLEGDEEIGIAVSVDICKRRR